MAGQVIINEFLTFVQNKIDILDELSIVQICVTNFTDAEIENGKEIVYNTCCDRGVRNVQRKGEDKKKKNIKDVIKLLKEVDPDVQPTFVAKDLNRLPPVSFDYVDVTRFLKDMAIMRTELSELKMKFSHELADIKNTFKSRKDRDTSIPQTVTNPEMVKNVQSIKPLPPMSAPQPECVHEEAAPNSRIPTYRDIVSSDDRSRQAKCARMKNVITEGISGAANHSDVRDLPATTKVKVPTDDEFQIVKNKKRKNKIMNMRGTYSAQCKIQVTDPECSIYISRASKTVTESDIKEHIHDMGQECLSVERLPQHKETAFNSFKVKILASRMSTFLETNFWPAGLVYRRFRERQTRNALNNKYDG